MEYREKHNTAQAMQDDSCIAADLSLLKMRDPNNPLLHRVGNNGTLSFELVFALLGIVTVEEISNNRIIFAASMADDPQSIKKGIIPKKKQMSKKKEKS